MNSEYIILIVWGSLFFLGFVFKAINYISTYPERREIDEILCGLKVHKERERILTLLKNSLPDGYRCGRKKCDGILLKQGYYYVCSRCHNMRTTIRITRAAK